MIEAYTGSDTYESYKKAKISAELLSKKLISPFEIIDADEISDPNVFLQEVEGIGMFSATAPILAKRLFANKKLTEFFVDNYKYLNQFDIVIWHDGKLDSKLKIAKILKDNAALYISELPKEGEFIHWITEEVKKVELDLKDIHIRFIYNRVELSKWMVLSELKKIKSYMSFNQKKTLSIEELEEIFGIDVKGDIWKFTDAVGMRKKAQALKEFEKLTSYEDNTQYLISMIHREFKLISQIIFARENNISAASLGINPYTLKKVTQKSFMFSWSEVQKFMRKLFDLDYAIKRGDIDDKLGLTLFLNSL